MASEKSQAQAVQYEREDTWSRIKGKTGKRVVGAIATATAAASMVLPLSACGEQSSGGGYNVPAASTEATPEHWTLDEVAFDEYMASLPSKAEQMETNKIPLDLNDADMGYAVADRLCNAINFGISQELRNIFNDSGEVKNEQDEILRKASIEQVAADISEENIVLPSLYFDKYPGVATYEDEYFDIVKNINKNSIGKYIYNQDSEPTTCTPVAIEPIEYINNRGFRLLYRYDGGLNETKLKKDINIPGVGSGNGFIKFSINENGDSVLIDGINKGEFWEVEPENWHVY